MRMKQQQINNFDMLEEEDMRLDRVSVIGILSISLSLYLSVSICRFLILFFPLSAFLVFPSVDLVDDDQSSSIDLYFIILIEEQR